MARHATGLILAVVVSALTAHAAETVTVSGLIIPLDNEGITIRTQTGEQVDVRWNDATQVALDVNTRQFANLKNGVLRYKVHSSSQVIDFPLPESPVMGIRTVRGGKNVEKALKEANAENWIPEFGLVLRFGEKTIPEQLPTADEPRFIGRWNPTTKPRTLSIGDRKYEVSLKKGGQTNALLYGVIATQDCTPFVNRAEATGIMQGDVLLARDIRVTPIGDQTAEDNPDLPRYLVIGDSISGNYDAGLREALSGTFNVHHPPTNCGPSGKGKGKVVEWLGAYAETGRHWDVVSFNFGHWDSGSTKATYQANLEAVVSHLEKTGAKLIWVTTCPVPDGYPPAGELQKRGKRLCAPGRTAGVMRKYLNPWAAEVIAEHPEITVCDQWQFVAAGRDGLYKEWWAGKNVHFKGEPANALGRLLAEHAKAAMREDD